jgi:hypothetical protein
MIQVHPQPVVISFNSKDRISGTNSNFVSTPIDIGINKFDSVCLVSASIPKSFYKYYLLVIIHLL